MSNGTVNRVTIIGNLGQNPEFKTSAKGVHVAIVSIATAESWKDKNTAEKKESTQWHRVVFYGKIAEIVNQYCKKGMKLFIEGKLNTRKYLDSKDHIERFITEIIGHEMQILSSKSNGQSSPKEQQESLPIVASSGAEAAEELEDDIPF